MIPPARPRQGTDPLPEEEGRLLRWAIGTWGAGVLYYAALFDRRWIPHDEGTLGQAAWRVLQGQVPHRDFDGMYTGLLDYVHAAAMTVLGVHLLTPRLLMLLAVMLWLPAIWSIAYRLVGSPVGAAAVTLTALLMGPPNYPAAMPSWYNLFFATWALWALIRWTDERRSRWLVLTGGLAGLSILFKVTGLYLLAGALFYVLHDEVSREEAPRDEASPTSGGSPASRPSLVRIFPLTAALVVVALLVAMESALVRSQAGLSTWVSYVLPTALLGAVLIWQAREHEAGWAALRRTVVRWTWLASGALIPVLLFLAWYGVSGGLSDLFRGVFVLPAQRLEDVVYVVPPLSRMWTILIPATLLVVGAKVGRGYRLAMAAAVVLACAALMLRMSPLVYTRIVDSLLLVVPAVAAGGAATIFSRRSDLEADDRPLLATLWVLALVHLIRYPFAVPIYFMYVAPLAVLAVGGLLARLASRDVPPLHPVVPRRATLAAVTLSYAVFFVVGPNRGGLFGPLPPLAEVRLPLERGRISVPVGHAAEYTQLVDVLKDLTRSPYVYAGPDAPEVSFLAGLENPTRSLFEIFEEDESRTRRTIDALESHDVNVIVINTRPGFSPMSVELLRALTTAYPNEVRIGQFVVRWRPAPPTSGGGSAR